MKRQRLLLIVALLAALAGGARWMAGLDVIHAQPGGYTLDWFAYSAAGRSSGGAYRQAGVIAPAAVGTLAGGEYALDNGFAGPLEAWARQTAVYLPQVRR